MNLSPRQFVDQFGWPEAERVALEAGTNRAYFSQLAGGHRCAGYALACRLVDASGGRLSLTALMDTRGDRAPKTAAR